MAGCRADLPPSTPVVPLLANKKKDPGYAGILGIHLTQVTPTSSVSERGGLSPPCDALAGRLRLGLRAAPAGPPGRLVAQALAAWDPSRGGVSRAHLDAYFDEFTFRFNRRRSRRATTKTWCSWCGRRCGIGAGTMPGCCSRCRR